MSFRPITDVWILARPKVRYYGAYPNGFLERALPLVGASDQDPVLHLCGGRAKDYPNKRLVANAVTVDVDPATQPDHLGDLTLGTPQTLIGHGFRAVIADPPYTEADHAHYANQGAGLPTANQILRLALLHVPEGGRVGVLHYAWPSPPKKLARSIACVGVICGFNNRMRCFSVFERMGGGA